MAFNPLDEKGISLEEQPVNWERMNVTPYDKNEIHPYSKCRLILMNGVEIESTFFLHQLARHANNIELKKKLSHMRRMEQQQQKMINWMPPADENVLEITIGFEQVAVDLTAYLARTEPDPNVKQALDFALLEDFDHLYRYANLYQMEYGKKAETLVGELTEITPGRPTIAEHRHPMDDIPQPVNAKTADPLTLLHINTIVAAEQQTMNFYNNVGNRPEKQLGRGLYMEIAMVEEEHVTHYESLMDPTATWFERLLLHDYTEAYLYYSCLQSEVDDRLKSMWERHMMMEIAHIHQDLELMREYEDKDGREMLPDEFPELTIFVSNKEYVRQILASQIEWTATDSEYMPVSELPANHRFFRFQGQVNSGTVPSVDVIRQHIDKMEQDYRFESEGPHPMPALRGRKSTHENVGRSKGRPAA